MALDLGKLAWSVQRPLLQHGALGWAVVAVCLLLLGQAVSLAWSSIRLSRLDVPVAVADRPKVASTPATSIPLPQFSERFDLTATAIAQLAPPGTMAPATIKFTYEDSAEAQLVRQTAIFATQAQWTELGPMLDRLQAVHRAAYISRLKLSREQANQPALDAEVQLAIAYLDDEGRAVP